MNRCNSCGKPIVSGVYCPPDGEFVCEKISIDTVHYIPGDRIPKEPIKFHHTIESRLFRAAYGTNCVYSVHGPLPLTTDIRGKNA